MLLAHGMNIRTKRSGKKENQKEVIKMENPGEGTGKENSHSSHPSDTLLCVRQLVIIY